MSGWWQLLGGVTVVCVAVAVVAVRAVAVSARGAVYAGASLARTEIDPIESSGIVVRTEELAERGRRPTAPDDTPR